MFIYIYRQDFHLTGCPLNRALDNRVFQIKVTKCTWAN